MADEDQNVSSKGRDSDDDEHTSRKEERNSDEQDLLSIREASLAMYVRESSGPLPSPDAFREYEDVLPGAADRILGMAEFQLHHRAASQKMGLWIMFVVAISFLIVSIALAILSAPAAAVLFPVVPSVVSGGAYIYGIRKRSERPKLPPGGDDKRPKLPPAT